MDEQQEAVSPSLMSRAEGAPDEMHQIPREITMLRGAVSSLHGVVNDLLSNLTPIMRNVPEDEVAKLQEIPTKFPVSTEVSEALRSITDEVSTIENKVARAVHRSEL